MIVPLSRGLPFFIPLWRGPGGGVQTVKIVYKTDRVHGLHWTEGGQPPPSLRDTSAGGGQTSANNLTLITFESHPA